MTWTLAFANGSTADIYSDGVNGSSVAITLSGGTSPDNNTGLIISLTSDVGGNTALDESVALVYPQASTSDVSGTVTDNLTVVLVDDTATTDIYLKISDATGESGTVQLTPHRLKPIALKVHPDILVSACNVLVTASPIQLADGSDIGAGVPLNWRTGRTSGYMNVTQDNNLTDRSTVAGKSDYKYETTQINDAMIKASGNGSITVTLKIGVLSFEMEVGTVKSLIQPPMAAPIWVLPENNQNIVDDDMYDLCKDSPGYPTQIPQVENDTKFQDTVILSAYAATDTRRSLPYHLSYHAIPAGQNQAINFGVDIPVNMTPFKTNGEYYLAYRYTKGATGNVSESAPTPVTVSLSEPQTDNNSPNPDLIMPSVSPNPYALANYDDEQGIVFTVNFFGKAKPSRGDTIQPKYSVTGYTYANPGYITEGHLDPYEITADDIANNVLEFTFPDADSGRQGWTAADMKDKEGSSGIMYWDYTPNGTQNTSYSPGRPWTVDTVAPYSTPPELPVPPEIEKARKELIEKFKARKK